jgi:hypothetical protein
MAPVAATYEPRDPSRTVLSKVITAHLETFLASLDAAPTATGLPASVQREFSPKCGILAHGCLRLRCDVCKKAGRADAPSAHAVAEGDAARLQLQAAGVVFLMCGPAQGPDRGPPGRGCPPRGADAPMGGVGPPPLAVLDGSFTGPDGTGPDDSSSHARAVRRAPSHQQGLEWPRPPGRSPCGTTRPHAPAPWRPPSRSASPVGRGPVSTWDGWAQAGAT